VPARTVNNRWPCLSCEGTNPDHAPLASCQRQHAGLECHHCHRYWWWCASGVGDGSDNDVQLCMASRAMLEAESSPSDSLSDTDSSSDITSSDSDSESDGSDDIRNRHSRHRSSTPLRHYRRDSLPCRGRDDSQSPSHPHHVTLVGTHLPLHGIVNAATLFQGVHLTLMDVTSVSVHRRHVKRVVVPYIIILVM